MCNECPVLQAEINRLQAANARLRNQVIRARKVIKAQKKQLDAVRQTAWKIILNARDAMSGHLPRGTWSLWRGRLEAAVAVFRVVFTDWTGLVQDIMDG